MRVLVWQVTHSESDDAVAKLSNTFDRGRENPQPHDGASKETQPGGWDRSQKGQIRDDASDPSLPDRRIKEDATQCDQASPSQHSTPTVRARSRQLRIPRGQQECPARRAVHRHRSSEVSAISADDLEEFTFDELVEVVIDVLGRDSDRVSDL